MSKLLPSKSLLSPQPNFKEKLCNLGLSPFIVISQSCRNKGAILYSSYYLKLPLFSSLFILFPFYFVILSYYIPALLFPAKANIRLFKLCIAKSAFWHIEYFFFLPLFAYIQLSTHFIKQIGKRGEAISFFSSMICNIFPNVRV